MSTNLPEVQVFTDANFGGDDFRTNLDITFVGSKLNDEISSIIVISGTWQFYTDSNFGGAASNPLTPGYYSFVGDPAVGIPNDTISSFQVLSFEPDGV